MQPVHSLLTPLGDEPRWLGHIDHFLEVAVQERRFDVHVVHLPATVRRQRQDEPHGLQSGHRREHLLEVHASTLHVAFSNEAGFVLDDVPFLILLQLVHPFEADRLMTCRERGERLGVVVVDGLQLVEHRPAPTVLVLGFGE